MLRPAGPPLHCPRPDRWSGVLLFVLAVVLVWSALPALLQTVPHADNVEQLNWAHGLQWGYLKHPPLPTALLWLGIALFGPSAFLTYALAMACVGLTLLLLWRAARLLLDARAALLALLLSSANYYLMGRGSFLNHNTVMLPFIAASAVAVLHLVRCPPAARQWHGWLLLGLAQALGLLTKYQMAIIIAANAAALLACYPWRGAGGARIVAGRVLLGALATVLPLLPHLAWLQQHAFSSFTYAGQNLLADLPPLERLRHTLGFLAQQCGRLAPAAIALALALLLARRAAGAPDAGAGASDTIAAATADPDAAGADTARRLRRALTLLALVPGAIVLGLALLGGVAPQNHWGASATLLLPLLAVARLRSAARPDPAPTLLAVLAVHALAVAWNVVAAAHAPDFHHRFAAQPLAALALAHWQQQVPGPLRVVIGPDWEAGALALELPGEPAVLASGDRRQAPWITDAQLEDCGALVVWRPEQTPESQIGAILARRIQAPVLLQTRVPHGALSALAAGILAPAGAGCPPGP